MERISSIDRALFGLLCLLLAWAPLPFASDHLWSEGLLIILSLLVLATWSIQYLRGKVRISHAVQEAKWPILFLAGIQIWALIQAFPFGLPTQSTQQTISVVPMESLHSAFYGIALTAIFASTLLLTNSDKRARILLWVLVIGGVFQACFGALMVLTGYEYTFFIEKTTFRGSNVGTMFYRNQQAGYLVLCMSAGIGLMISDMKGGAKNLKQWVAGFSQAVVGSKGALRICLIIIVAGLVMTRSRMGNSSFAIGLAVAGIIYLLARKESRTSGLIFLASIVAIDILILGTFFDLHDLSQRIIATDVSSDGRALMTPQSWEATRAYMPFGSGAMGYYSAFIPFREHTFGGLAMTHAHNDYLELLLEYGVIGVLLMVAFWLSCFVKAVRSLMFSKYNLARGTAFAVVMLLVAIALHSTVDYNLQAASYPFSMMILIACLYATDARRKKDPIRR